MATSAVDSSLCEGPAGVHRPPGQGSRTAALLGALGLGGTPRHTTLQGDAACPCALAGPRAGGTKPGHEPSWRRGKPMGKVVYVLDAWNDTTQTSVIAVFTTRAKADGAPAETRTRGLRLRRVQCTAVTQSVSSSYRRCHASLPRVVRVVPKSRAEGPRPLLPAVLPGDPVRRRDRTPTRDSARTGPTSRRTGQGGARRRPSPRACPARSRCAAARCGH